MDSELKDMLPGSLQAYANVGMALVVMIVGFVGYYKKMRGEQTANSNLTTYDALTDRRSAILEWLEKLYVAVMTQDASLKSMVKLLEARDHREELDREYRRGRDEREERRDERRDRDDAKRN